MLVAKSLLETPWSIAIDPARRDGRIVAESSEPERKAKPVAMPRSLDPGLVEALGRAGIERLYSHQREALKAAAASNLVITSGTASGKSLAFNLPVLDGIARDPKRRALYLYPTKALAQDQARKLAALRPPGLREAIYDGDTPREERPGDPPPQQPRPHQPRHAARRPAAQPQELGGLHRQPRLGRRRRGAHLPRRLRLARRQRAAAAAAGGAGLRRRAALPAHLGDDRQPGRAGGAAGRRAVRADRRRRRAAAAGARSRCGTRR